MEEKEFEVNIEEFKRDDIPVLKSINQNKELKKIAKEEGIYIGDSGWYNFLASFSLICLIIFLILVPLLIYGGYLKSSIESTLICGNTTTICEKTDVNFPGCPSFSCPTISIPSCPEVNCYFNSS